MFSIEMLPASYGDALWIDYGDPKRPRRVLVDGGKLAAVDAIAERIRAAASADPRGVCRFELAVLSHIDGDHIEGFLSLVRSMGEGKLPMEVGEIWFNGAPQLPEANQTEEPPPPGYKGPDFFGALQGEMLSALLLDKKLPWNLWSATGPIFIPKAGPLPVFELEGGMKLTLLGPTFDRLVRLRKKWDAEIEAWTKKTGKELDNETLLSLLAERPEGRIVAFSEDEGIDVEALLEDIGREDTSEPNGSSIAFLAELNGTSCLLPGDAFARDIAAAVRRLLKERAPKGEAPPEKLKVDALKVAHHGSRGNISEELLSLLDCDTFLVSTNGAVFHHPDQEAIARIVAGAGRRAADARAARTVHLKFNYRSPQTQIWSGEDANGRSLPEAFNFQPEYPPKGNAGLRVILSP